MRAIKILLLIGRILLLAIIMLLLLILSFYLLAPSFRFEQPKPFYGQKLYNPYQNVDTPDWYKYNFQVQSKAWGGITDGRLNSNAMIDSIYQALGYDHVATSDYQKINRYKTDENAYIPTYEHGYGIRKTHQVCLGASQVLWLDYPFYQSIHHKQHIINKLNETCQLIAIAHPLLRNGYTFEDLKYLSGYQLMEVLNNLRVSLDHWDTALSNGHRIYILANDDAHDVSNSNEVGRRFTMIHAENQDSQNIISALDQGIAYGMDFIRIDDEPMLDKFERSKNIPYLLSAKLVENTFKIKVSEKADSLRFIGQKGKRLQTTLQTDSASYLIGFSDTYVRTEVFFNDGSVMYLNPVTRHNDLNNMERQNLASIHTTRTWLFRSGNILLLAILVFFTIKRHSRLKKAAK